jgi:tyrosinase
MELARVEGLLPAEGDRIWTEVGFSRRRFLQVAGLTGLAVVLASCTPGQIADLLNRIANRPVRRGVNTLAPTDPILEAYRAAVTAMQRLPSSDRRNWTRQAEIHLNFCPHGNWLFLPWHRAYLYYFEEICRELSGMNEFALPYWNWQDNPTMPAVFWDAASPLYNGTRTSTASSALPATVFGAPAIETILDQPNFLLFASGQIPLGGSQRQSAAGGQLEGGPHNRVHTFTGGDMGGYLSPLDPVFWTHHNMIEAVWVEWNIRRGNPNTNHSDWLDRQFTEFCDRAGNPVTVKVRETVFYPFFNYRFDDPVLGVP